MSELSVNIEEYEYFRFSDSNDPSYNDAGLPWSRPYEYCWALNAVRRAGGSNPFLRKSKAVLNSAWGYEGCHLQFRQALDQEATTLHTDLLTYDDMLATKIAAYNQYPTFILNLADYYEPFESSFDVSLCISVVEHMPVAVTRQAMANLVRYTKPGGLVGITFDLPSESGEWIVRECGKGRMPVDDGTLLSGTTSVLPNPRYGHLRVGRVLLRRMP
ncbi:MAG: class I SAM-dependent methyltransferase [Methylobacterium frigidaeris]